MKKFTDREKLVLSYLYMGVCERDIAKSMNVNYKTVNSFKLSAMRKVGIRKNANLIFWLRTSEANFMILKA
ncbi:hypothetical protein AXT60_24985 [Salmonella enterica subsp. enterica]|nr:hypothetical protein BVG94_25310 [Serratia marcescens]EBQ2012529.1 hypothetical protein [Salmonella enterica subsp. enterica]ECJ6738157.1 hypothetical protein [Salmonella enterica subsp. enterica]HEJ6930952.1 hypothetical protein [Serratia marcescens]HEJ7075814.1 hypothetical protein [Serratia marcescens]